MTANRVVRALFDNNAWSDIVIRDPTAKMLSKLQDAVVHDAVQILVTTALIEETLAYAETSPTEVRKRIAYLRAFGHGHLLRPPSEMIQIEIHGELSDGKTFLSEQDESQLYGKVLDVCDTRGNFVSPTDGQTYQAAALVGDAKMAERDSVRFVENGAREEILTLWKRESAKGWQENGEPHSELGLDPEAADGVVLRAWGEKMVQEAPGSFESWVTKFLTDRNAPASVINESVGSHPFVSAYVAYLYAHAARNFRTGKLSEKGDSYDKQYCVLSVAADVLVTSDASLCCTWRLMPFRPFKVLSTQQFIGSLA